MAAHRQAGFDDGEIGEIIVAVAQNIFTNSYQVAAWINRL